jgi:hypothetical protein
MYPVQLSIFPFENKTMVVLKSLIVESKLSTLKIIFNHRNFGMVGYGYIQQELKFNYLNFGIL